MAHTVSWIARVAAVSLLSGCMASGGAGGGHSLFGVPKEMQRFEAATAQFHACDDRVQDTVGMSLLNVKSPESTSAFSPLHLNDASYATPRESEILRAYLQQSPACFAAYAGMDGPTPSGELTAVVRAITGRFRHMAADLAERRITWGQFNRARVEHQRRQAVELAEARDRALRAMGGV